MLADLLGAYCLCHCGTKQAKREPPGVPNLHRETFIVLFACLPTVAFARAAARRDIEEYFVLETMGCDYFCARGGPAALSL